jgi:hypothetical protein
LRLATLLSRFGLSPVKLKDSEARHRGFEPLDKLGGGIAAKKGVNHDVEGDAHTASEQLGGSAGCFLGHAAPRLAQWHFVCQRRFRALFRSLGAVAPRLRQVLRLVSTKL